MHKENPILEIISHKEAIERFDLNKYHPFVELDASVVLVMNGDTHIKEDLDSWYMRVLEGNSEYDGTLMIIVNGTLIVDGIATGKEDCNAHLLVLGDLHCEILRSYDEFTHITGNAFVKYIYDGNYNSGSITIKGVTDVPFLLNSNHSSEIKPSEKTVSICYSGDDGFFEYDLTEEGFEEALIAEIYNDGNFNIDAFYAVVKSGASPFVEGYQYS